MADKFTPEQRRAVTETEGNMLVSASAGSGKTYVMIERLIGIVLDGKAKVSEILAVTFTEAAAAEMKQKLVSALRKRLIDGGDNSAVRAALDEVPSASISTIHKFCADLLRSYFYEIGLDPAFKIADETAACEIQNAAGQDVFGTLRRRRRGFFVSRADFPFGQKRRGTQKSDKKDGGICFIREKPRGISRKMRLLAHGKGV